MRQVTGFRLSLDQDYGEHAWVQEMQNTDDLLNKTWLADFSA